MSGPPLNINMRKKKSGRKKYIYGIQKLLNPIKSLHHIDAQVKSFNCKSAIK